MEKREIKWINCAKFLAIVAVMIDHTNQILYTNTDVAVGSYFSVSLFILISGMMSYRSNDRHKELSYLQAFIRSSKSIFIAYLFATFFYMCCTMSMFDLNTYLNYIMYFNISGPFYYVALYLQLMLVSGIVYKLINLNYRQNKLRIFKRLCIVIIILFISFLTTNYTNILNIYGGGGKLFGGTFLILFYIGMLLEKYNVFKNLSTKKNIIITIFSLVAWFAWWRFVCVNQFQLDRTLPFGFGFNPPSISLGIMAMLVLCFSYGVFTLLQTCRYTKGITSVASWIGKHTLYIFLFHRFFLDNLIPHYLTTENIWINRVVYFSVMIFGSILLEYIVKYIKHILSDSTNKIEIHNNKEYPEVKR